MTCLSCRTDYKPARDPDFLSHYRLVSNPPWLRGKVTGEAAVGKPR